MDLELELDLFSTEEYVAILAQQDSDYLNEAIAELEELAQGHVGECPFQEALDIHKKALEIVNARVNNTSVQGYDS